MRGVFLFFSVAIDNPIIMSHEWHCAIGGRHKSLVRTLYVMQMIKYHEVWYYLLSTDFETFR